MVALGAPNAHGPSAPRSSLPSKTYRGEPRSLCVGTHVIGSPGAAVELPALSQRALAGAFGSPRRTRCGWGPISGESASRTSPTVASREPPVAVAAKDIGSSKELLHADASAEMLVSTAAITGSSALVIAGDPTVPYTDPRLRHLKKKRGAEFDRLCAARFAPVDLPVSEPFELKSSPWTSLISQASFWPAPAKIPKGGARLTDVNAELSQRSAVRQDCWCKTISRSLSPRPAFASRQSELRKMAAHYIPRSRRQTVTRWRSAGSTPPDTSGSDWRALARS